MKNIIIKDDVYNKLITIKGKRSFSDLINDLIEESVEKKRKNLRMLFGSVKDAEIKEITRVIDEVRKGGKGRIF